MKRKEENRSVIAPSCTFFKPNKINFLPSNRVLDRKPDRVTGYKVLIDLTSLLFTQRGHCGPDRMVVGLTTTKKCTCTINAYQH